MGKRGCNRKATGTWHAARTASGRPSWKGSKAGSETDTAQPRPEQQDSRQPKGEAAACPGTDKGPGTNEGPGRTRDRGGRGTSPCGASGGEPRHRGRAPWRGSREEVGDRRTRENEHRGVRPPGAQSRQVTETEAQGSPGWGGGSPTAGSGLSSEGGKRPEHGGWGRPPDTVNEPVPLEPHTSTRSRREIFRAFYHN